MALFLMNPYTVASLGVLGVPPKIGCAMHTLEPLCPTVAAVSMWLESQPGLRNEMKVTGEMSTFLNKLKVASEPKYQEYMNSEWGSPIMQMNDRIAEGWKKRQIIRGNPSHRPCATDLPTPDSAVFSDVFVLALLALRLMQTRRSWPRSPSGHPFSRQ